VTAIDSFINQEIGHRYLVRDLIGEGAHARVYRATDAVKGADVALKLYHADALDAQLAEAARQFEVWEGTAILPLLEVHPEFLEGEVTVMPLMAHTLAQINPIFASDAIYYTRRILTALEFCHGRDVIHGDVKPTNVFINDRGIAFLGDFGVKDFLPDGKRGHTLEYAAPELLDGNPRSLASDVWATAVTLFELLTGELPFGSRADMPEQEIAAKVMAAEYRHPDEIRPYLPMRVRNFFRSCFVADLPQRPIQTADGMRESLSDVEVRAEWVLWRKAGYAAYWEGYEVASGRRTGVRYAATVRQRPRLACWEAEMKRAPPEGELRRWKGLAPYRGTRLQTMHRIALWMRNVTGTGKP
jgi:serine/threonine protein kinase